MLGGITPKLFNTVIKNAMWYHTQRATTYSKLKMKGVRMHDIFSITMDSARI